MSHANALLTQPVPLLGDLRLTKQVVQLRRRRWAAVVFLPLLHDQVPSRAEFVEWKRMASSEVPATSQPTVPRRDSLKVS